MSTKGLLNTIRLLQQQIAKFPSLEGIEVVEKCDCIFCNSMRKTGTGNWCKEHDSTQGEITRPPEWEDIDIGGLVTDLIRANEIIANLMGRFDKGGTCRITNGSLTTKLGCHLRIKEKK